ncbi:MAG: archease [Acidobacteriota bacterium]
MLDHTADYMVEIRAPDLRSLFAEAAVAFLDILSDPETVRPRLPVAVQVEAENTEALLVSWLTELLFLYESEGWLFSRFEFFVLTGTQLEAEAWGEKLDPSRHPIDREIKAVTYHRLRLVKEGDGLKTTIVFDL